VTNILWTEVMFLEAGPAELHYDGTRWLAVSQRPHTDAAAPPIPAAPDSTCPGAGVPRCACAPPSRGQQSALSYIQLRLQ
jgi:hypothetical protein